MHYSLLRTCLLALALMALNACNTIEGAGQDIKSAGQWTADSAQKVKKKID
jgi:predicted small secreted protein